MCRSVCCNSCCYCNCFHSYVGTGLIALCCSCICYDSPTNAIKYSLDCNCIKWFCCKVLGCGVVSGCGSCICCFNDGFDNEACELKIKEVSENYRIGTINLSDLKVQP